jgi:hypothetical protein
MLRLVPVLLALTTSFNALAQSNNYSYILRTFAGSFPLGDGGPATSALLFYPNAAVPDAAGNLYIVDPMTIESELSLAMAGSPPTRSPMASCST